MLSLEEYSKESICLDPAVSCRVLDKGFVRYVNHLGNDQSVVDAARVSYQSGTKRVRTDDALINYLVRNQHFCYDEDTELLIKEGNNIHFKKFKDISITDATFVAAYNKYNKSFKFEKLKEIYKFKYNGSLVSFQQKHVDLKVTPNHKVLFRKKVWSPKEHQMVWEDSLSVDYAENLYDKSMIKFISSGKYETFTKTYLNDFEYGQFLGFFVGDGFRYSKNIISFRLKKERKVSYITSILDIIKVPYAKNKDKYNVTNIRVYIPNGKAIYSCFYRNNKKYIPNWILTQSEQFLSGFLDGNFNSDGSYHRESRLYTTTVNQVADRLQTIHLLLDRPVSKNSPTKLGLIKLLEYKCVEPVLNQKTTNGTFEEYKGNVYCCTVSSGLIIVRRNGKTCVSGNSPCEMVEITFHVKMPIFVARQWVRHRTANMNEKSARYSEMEEEFYYPDQWRKQSKRNKQVSEEFFNKVRNEEFNDYLIDACNSNYSTYKNFLKDGVGRELSRMVLPINLYTEFYWKCDARNLAHFLHLRSDSHAQWEIRQYTYPMKVIFKTIAPILYNAYEEYVWNAVNIKLSQNILNDLEKITEPSQDTLELKKLLEKGLLHE